jgi:outer membrane protein TolC
MMMMRLLGPWSVLVAAVATAFPTPQLAAQLVDGSLETITLDVALAKALARSPIMAQSDLQVENAATGRTAAVGAFLPSLSVSSGASLRSEDRFDAATDRIVTGSSDSYNAGVSTSLALFSGGRRFAELDRSRADLFAAEAQRDDQRFQVTLQTKRFFFAALRQGELLDVANARLSQGVESLDMTRRQAQVGMATRSDTLRARLEMVNARQAVLEAETATRSARFALARQVGGDEPVIPVVPDGLEPEPLPVSDEQVLRLAEEAAPSVRAAAASTSAASASYSAARSGYLPTIRLSSGYNWANTAASFDGGRSSWSLNLSGTYAIFNGFQRETAIARADETRNVARLQEEDARLAARQAADGALRTLAAAAMAIDIAREAVVLADEDLRAIRERYRLGVATALDVVTSQIALDQARANLVGSRYDYVTAKAELEAVLGRGL